MGRRWLRRVERCCCACATYFPLLFVYGLTTWAVWVLVNLGATPSQSAWLGTTSSLIGLVLYGMLNWSYTTAVFTDPGSTTGAYPLASRRGGYSALPTQAPPTATNFTVKSNGEMRFCKKCASRKPDRAHHCSTCRRCVLKMDHHCPWLATCVGLHNHKAFLLFLIYTTIFCIYCFACSGSWTYTEVFTPDTVNYNTDSFMPVNFIMLCVISGIIGLVVGAFTCWHILLASRGQTTIECLEKTRYLSPLRKSLQASFAANHGPGAAAPGYGQQLLDMHSNALPGITRPEEGEDIRNEPPPSASFSGHSSTTTVSTASSASSGQGYVQPLIAAPSAPGQMTGPPGTQLSYADLERYRARKRYETYLDEQDSSKLPHAFDLGAKKNLLHLFGPSWYLWLIPVCNTTGDGWSWEASPKWIEARDRIGREREEQRARESAAGWGEPDTAAWARNPAFQQDRPQGAGRHFDPYAGHTESGRLNSGPSGNAGRKPLSKADRVLGRDPNLYADLPQPPVKHGQDVNMKRLSARGLEIPDLDSDDEDFLDEEEEEVVAAASNSSSVKAPENGGTSGRRSPVKGLVLQPGNGVGASGLLRKNSPTLRTPPLPPPVNSVVEGDSMERKERESEDEID